MKNNLKFLGSAQPFGFGGITELMALEGAIRKDERAADATIYTVENPQFASAIKDVRKRFELLPRQNGKSYLEHLFSMPQLAGVDAVISSYDTAAVFFGWYNEVPVYLYDGMMWFWEPNLEEGKIESDLDALQNTKSEKDINKFIKIYEDLVKADYHSTVFLAYHLSNRVYARNGQGVKERIAKLSSLAGKTKVVGAMIDPDFLEQDGVEREHVLVSLSGSLAPTVKFEDNVAFAKGALNFTREAIKILNIPLPWIFCCHPKIQDALKKEGAFEELPSGLEIRASMPYQENLKAIQRAHALFASPGFSSVQEAAVFRTPLFFLPEQNGGQPKGFSSLKNAGYPFEHNLTVTDHVDGGAVTKGEYDTKILYKDVSHLWSPQMGILREEILGRFAETLANGISKRKLVEGQHASVRKLMGGFNGAKSVIIDLLDHLNE